MILNDKQEINNENLDNTHNILAEFFKEHTKEQIMMDVLIAYDCFFKYLCTYESDLDAAMEDLKEYYNIDEEEVLKFFITEFKIYCQTDCQDRYRPID